jgi:hypothetical protein
LGIDSMVSQLLYNGRYLMLCRGEAVVHVPTRGDVPVRLGPGIPITPGDGPSAISRQPYTDPVQFELEREKVLNTTWLIAGRSADELMAKMIRN